MNTKTFTKLKEAIGVVGLHGLDTLYGYMIKNQLQHVQNIFRSHPERNVVSTDMKDFDQFVLKGQKSYQQLADTVVQIGTLQLLRKHIAYQLNTTCKFDSAQLEASLRTMNEWVFKLILYKNSFISAYYINIFLCISYDILSQFNGMLEKKVI